MPQPKTLRLAGEATRALTKRVTFTVKALDHATCPRGKGRTWLYDSRVPGLALMVTEAGAKTFYLYRKVNGRPMRYKLAAFPAISIDQARTLALNTLADIANGVNPQEKKRQARAAQTFGELWGWYLENHAKPKKRSWASDEYRYNKYLKRWAGRRLADITRADVQALHTRMSRNHPTGANRLLALVSVMFSKATLQGFTGANPTEGIERNKETSRRRFLGADELPKFFAAMEDEQTPEAWRHFFSLLIFTGARSGNVKSMRWADLDLGRAEWHIRDEDFKTGRGMTVALTAPALEVLKARLGNGSEWVFPASSASGHIEVPRKAWENLLKRAGLVGVRLHDLRRTFGSWAAATNASLPIIGAALGHKTPSVTQVYARLDLDPIRKAVNAATDAMLEAAKAKPAQNTEGR